ncbi:MAG: KamA family radical SAM protein [Thermodesulfobacteriota bacterium]
MNETQAHEFEPPSEPPSKFAEALAPALSLFKPATRLAAVRRDPQPLGEASRAFRDRHFPGVADTVWNDWHWQLKNRFLSADALSRVIDLTEDERLAMSPGFGRLPVAVTPYYASLINPEDPHDPLRRCVAPTTAELSMHANESADPLGEEHDSPAPGLVHRYPDRVLFLTTDFCSTYCRYCTRSRRVGKAPAATGKRKHWEAALDYIAATPAVRDVLLSGGDPLTMPDAAIEYLLSRLRAIPHVEMVRLGTKVPAVLPQRITPALTRMLRRYHPLFMSIHCTHPAELTPEMRQACGRLADAGIPLGSQTVLLAGVNDDPAVMLALMRGLLTCRVRPYYLYQCDEVAGMAHFRTPLASGIEVIRALRGHTSGYAVPHFVVDLPGGGGKTPVLPEYLKGRDGCDLVFENYEGKTYRTFDPPAPGAAAPVCPNDMRGGLQ